MSALLNSIEHALSSAANDVVKVGKFVEQSALPVLKKAQTGAPAIEAVTALVSPQAANIERVGFAVLGVVIKALDDAGTAARANGLNLSPRPERPTHTLTRVFLQGLLRSNERVMLLLLESTPDAVSVSLPDLGFHAPQLIQTSVGQGALGGSNAVRLTPGGNPLN
jgi:hypothetical protein